MDKRALIIIVAIVVLLPIYTFLMYFMTLSMVEYSIIHMVMGSIMLLFFAKLKRPVKPMLIISLISGFLMFAFNLYASMMFRPFEGMEPLTLFTIPNPFVFFGAFIVFFNLPSLIYPLFRR